MKNYYHILEVEATASKQAIKLAYVELAKNMYRKLKTGDQYFKQKYDDIQEAYDVLSDDVKRKE